MKYDNVYVYSGSIFDMDKNGLMDDVDAPKRFEMELISNMSINSFDIPLFLNIHYDYIFRGKPLNLQFFFFFFKKVRSFLKKKGINVTILLIHYFWIFFFQMG